MDLTTGYLGLTLRNPLIASASPLSNTVDGVRRLADAGVGAVVLYSLFEEQVRREMEENARLAEAGTEVFAESLSYFPAEVEEDSTAEDAIPRRYLSLLERAAAAVDVPVIGSLNGVTTGGWTSYARAMQDAGAAAIELNIYYIPGDAYITGREVEQRHIDILGRVKAAVTVPVAVKLGPYFSSTGEIALRLDEAGADGLVLFNRFLQPDIDPETLAVRPAVDLSSPAEARLPQTWISLLRKYLRASLAATTGVEGPAGRGQVPPGRRRCRDDRVRADQARTRACRRPARRPGRMDGPEGILPRSPTCEDCSPCPPLPTRPITSVQAMSARCTPPTWPTARGDAGPP